jgi:hypothetical protein
MHFVYLDIEQFKRKGVNAVLGISIISAVAEPRYTLYVRIEIPFISDEPGIDPPHIIALQALGILIPSELKAI